MKNKNYQNEDTRFSSSEQGKKALKNFQQRLRVANRSEQTVRNYLRSIEALMNFHEEMPEDLDVDQIVDFLHDLKIEKERNWRTIKIYVAGIRWYYQHVLNDEDTAMLIPYPKEEKTLPKILSREELSDLFDACKNPKHRIMFRLMYSSGLRRGELIRLTPEDIDTKDGKCRVRILRSKGNKDRYTVLSKKVLEELREYYMTCHPKTYLFNGRYKSQSMSSEGLRHALAAAVKKAGIRKDVNMHILRHSFATHCIEHGMNIKTLQYLMGHSSVLTTMIYLHISQMPLEHAFSPIDKWEA
ncbi:MAG: tyrosine-type recombinase/integrase [Salinivirgaceae bacterium]|jgi:integrase/recombinase XerD|nr:tyrosine-type recombinase/integrase [Salinivirgaceae bacterium]